jgi:hypothetical protein
MSQKPNYILLGLALLSASISLSGPLDKADKLWNQRADGLDTVNQAMTAYNIALSSAEISLADKVHAASQWARLAILKGEILNYPSDEAENKDELKNLFQDCLNKVETHINPAKSGGSLGDDFGRYHYFRLACYSYWFKQLNLGGKLFNKGSFLGVIKEASGYEQTKFEGGGVARFIAGIYVSETARSRNDKDFYKPEESLKLIKMAMEVPENTDRAYPKSIAGQGYYGNQYILARALHFLKEDGKGDQIIPILGPSFIRESLNGIVDAREYLRFVHGDIQQALEDANTDFDVIGGRIVETKYELNRIEDLMCNLGMKVDRCKNLN